MNPSIVEEFTDMINQSRGRVMFVTAEGDRLVANSMLSALVGFSTILSVARAISLQVECEFEDDCLRISEFLRKYQLAQFRPDTES